MLKKGENARVCTNCQKLKHFDKFYDNNSCKYNKTSRCKDCIKLKQRNKTKYILKNSVNRNYKKFRELVQKVKKCNKCNKIKSWSEFHTQKDKKYNISVHCKDCNNKTNKKYRENNKEKEKQRSKKYYEENKEKVLKINKNWVEKNLNKWYKYRNEYRKNRRKNDINFKLRNVLRSRVNSVLFNKSKHEKTLKMLGCSVKEFKRYIENQFNNTMSWDNHGEFWHLDHEIPCANFDLTDAKQQAVCFHYSNYQPLSAKENVSKQDTIPNLLQNITLTKKFLNKYYVRQNFS